MGQRINIQYTIELEELEEEVTRLINKNYAYLNHAQAALSTAKSLNIFSRDNLRLIDNARLELARTDLGLQDCSNIIEGYINYMETSDADAPAQPSQPDSVGGGDMSELKERLEKFKNSIEEQHEVAD